MWGWYDTLQTQPRKEIADDFNNCLIPLWIFNGYKKVKRNRKRKGIILYFTFVCYRLNVYLTQVEYPLCEMLETARYTVLFVVVVVYMIYFICLSVCAVFVWVSEEARMRTLDLQTFVSHLMWVLGTAELALKAYHSILDLSFVFLLN